jgi:hypothetical protein
MRFEPQLRGQVWSLERASAAPTAELLGWQIEKRDPSTLPAEFEVLPVLQRLFQTKDLVCPNTNPFPDRVIPEITEVAPLKLATTAPYRPVHTLTPEEREEKQRRRDARAKELGVK